MLFVICMTAAALPVALYRRTSMRVVVVKALGLACVVYAIVKPLALPLMFPVFCFLLRAVVISATNIQAPVVTADREGAWLLLRPVLRVWGHLVSSTAPATATQYQLDVGNPNNNFDHYFEIPSLDPNITGGADGSAGSLIATFANPYMTEGVWAFNAEMSLVSETLGLVSLTAAGPSPITSLTQGITVGKKVRYLNNTFIQNKWVGVQHIKGKIYLSKLLFPDTLQVRKAALIAGCRYQDLQCFV